MSIRKLIAIITTILGVGFFGVASAAASPLTAHPTANGRHAGTPRRLNITPVAVFNRGSTPMYMNVKGGSCSANAAVIGWPTKDGVLYNERFNIWGANRILEFQATWCGNNGDANSGLCVADDATQYHLLHLAKCNFNSNWDTFAFLPSGNTSQLMNLEYSSDMTANNSAGGQMWDGNYVYGNSDWNYCNGC